MAKIALNQQTHIWKLVGKWESEGLSSSTIQNRISVFRQFSEWINKRGMIRSPNNYVKNKEAVKRSYKATSDKSWDGNGIKVKAKIKEVASIDHRVAIALELQREFGLIREDSCYLNYYDLRCFYFCL